MWIALLLAVSAAAPPSVEAAAERFGPALVTVHFSAVDRGQELSSVGFFVSSAGTLATALPAGVSEVVVELANGDRRPGHLLVRDADGVALVSLAPGQAETPLLAALAVAVEDRVLAPQVWLLGVGVIEGRVEPALGGLRRVDERGRWHLDLPLERGAPVLHEGRVVAMVLARDGRTASIAVPAGRLRALAARMARPSAPPR